MASQNTMTDLESALTRLDRMVGIGVASTTRVTATHVRARTERGGGNLLAEIPAPFVRSAASGLLSDGNSGGISGGSGTSGFSLSSGQGMAELAASILRANKRYL